jgi:pimeloyl-ACP methyl ester carboxylesterase
LKVYFISGLAADSTVFKYLQLPSHCEAIYLDWLKPEENESLTSYTTRLMQGVNPNEKFSVVGLSFGGMIASEIAKRSNPEHVILISSVPSIQHLPGYFKLAAKLRLHKLVPISFIQHAAILKRLFTTETPDDKKMLKAMIRKSDPFFIRWAMNAVLTWDNCDVPANLCHIHGTKDEVLPYRFTKPTHTIKTGGHLMVLNRAREINKILAEVLGKEEYTSQSS